MDNQNLNNKPNLMRESVDKDGNVINNNNNQEPDIADKTIDAVEGFINTCDHKKEFNSEEVKKYKTSAMICYIPVVPFYYILTNKLKQSNYLKFHVNQGLNVTILCGIVFFISSVLKVIFTTNSMLRDNTPGWVSFITYILYCISFLAIIFGIINTYNNSSKELPLIGKIKLLK